MDVGLATLEHGAPDGDRGVEVAVVAEVAHRATVQPAPLALRGGDQLHRADLGRARERPRREHGAQRVERIQVGLEPPFDVRYEVQDVAVALDLHVLAHGHGARPRHAPEIVATEVDEHHMFRAFLGVGLELLGEERVRAGIGAARPCAGDRVGGELVALDLEEQLGRGADDLERRGPDEEQVRTRVDPPERPVQPDPVEGRACGGIIGQRKRLAPREHDLDRLARGDRLLGHLDRVDVGVSTEAGLDGRGKRGAVLAGDRGGPTRAPLRPPAPFSSEALGRAVRSSASKIAASAIR